MIYFWSDPHFNHRKILDFCPARREWADSAEGMNEVLIANWNAAVRPQRKIMLVRFMTAAPHKHSVRRQ